MFNNVYSITIPLFFCSLIVELICKLLGKTTKIDTDISKTIIIVG